MTRQKKLIIGVIILAVLGGIIVAWRYTAFNSNSSLDLSNNPALAALSKARPIKGTAIVESVSVEKYVNAEEGYSFSYPGDNVNFSEKKVTSETARDGSSSVVTLSYATPFDATEETVISWTNINIQSIDPLMCKQANTAANDNERFTIGDKAVLRTEMVTSGGVPTYDYLYAFEVGTHCFIMEQSVLRNAALNGISVDQFISGLDVSYAEKIASDIITSFKVE